MLISLLGILVSCCPLHADHIHASWMPVHWHAHDADNACLTGGLSSAISLFAMMRFGSWIFGGGQMAFQAELYGGLLVFMGYILFDTQVGCTNRASLYWLH